MDFRRVTGIDTGWSMRGNIDKHKKVLNLNLKPIVLGKDPYIVTLFKPEYNNSSQKIILMKSFGGDNNVNNYS